MITIGSNTKIKNSIIGSNRSRKEKQLQQQITQLTNNWNELEEWLKEQLMYFNDNNEQGGFSTNVEDLEIVLDKMKEIKEGKSENRK